MGGRSGRAGQNCFGLKTLTFAYDMYTYGLAVWTKKLYRRVAPFEIQALLKLRITNCLFHSFQFNTDVMNDQDPDKAWVHDMTSIHMLQTCYSSVPKPLESYLVIALEREISFHTGKELMFQLAHI